MSAATASPPHPPLFLIRRFNTGGGVLSAERDSLAPARRDPFELTLIVSARSLHGDLGNWQNGLDRRRVLLRWAGWIRRVPCRFPIAAC